MNDQQLMRYSRHILLDGFDVEGQEALLNASVLVVGAGGLGSPVALYLAAAGVGELWLADDDLVEASNLQRQIAHTEADIGSSKVSSAAASCQQRNAQCRIHQIDQRLVGAALDEVISRVDLVADCSDNFSTRFAVNTACLKFKVPLVSGAAIRGEGQVAVFDSRNPASPCYACLYQQSDDDALNCAEAGVLGPMVGVIGSIQAMEIVKCLAGYGKPLVGRLLIVDGRSMEFREIKLGRDAQCRACGVAV